VRAYKQSYDYGNQNKAPSPVVEIVLGSRKERTIQDSRPLEDCSNIYDTGVVIIIVTVVT
jgi:hypothetical protein